MVKKDLVDAMAWDHPTRTLELGTINPNVTRALNKDHSQPEPSVLLPRINSCLSRVVRLSSKVKRTCQIAIGLYIEQLALHHIQEDERRKEDNKENGETEDDGKEDDGKKEKEGQEKDLANFSKGETEREPTTQEGLEDVDDSGDKRNIQLQFLSCLLTAIYTAKRPSVKEKEVAGKATIVPGMPANKHYKNGTIDLCKKIEVLKAKGHLPSGVRGFIDPKKSAIENFILLNRACGSRRSLVPVSSFDDKFVTLSELDLSRIFWRDPFLTCRIQSLAVEYFDAIQYADQVSQADVADWLTGATPGEFITKLLTDIGGYSQEERRRLRNYSRTTFLMPIEEMRAHLYHIRADSFQPATYAGRGYVLRGSIRTDGFRLQAIAFKLNELHCVKYRRLHPDRLLTGATRLQSALGGTDYFLTEIRNVLETKQDVEGLWGCDPRLIKVLGIDLGQAFVVGASAILPPSEQPSVEIGQESDDAIMEPSSPTIEEVGGSGVSETERPPAKYFNLACKQKAVYQPTFKHRRWLEQRKGQSTEGGESISHIETSLPTRRGPEASIKDYAARVEEVKDDLDSFYGSVVLKKHSWNARKARAEEYRLIANRLLQLVGGSLGARREVKNKVIIGVGLGQFSSKTTLSSLYESFQSNFVQKATKSAPCIH
ncbi:hypothetical protein F5H01DRAFT_366477 [Linnemannia elongata]|nr:hypothetical protein F5H01DRAFT_366477 [Linnemannia elongata]